MERYYEFKLGEVKEGEISDKAFIYIKTDSDIKKIFYMQKVGFPFGLRINKLTRREFKNKTKLEGKVVTLRK